VVRRLPGRGAHGDQVHTTLERLIQGMARKRELLALIGQAHDRGDFAERGRLWAEVERLQEAD
jgi:hypothetical protein